MLATVRPAQQTEASRIPQRIISHHWNKYCKSVLLTPAGRSNIDLLEYFGLHKVKQAEQFIKVILQRSACQQQLVLERKSLENLQNLGLLILQSVCFIEYTSFPNNFSQDRRASRCLRNHRMNWEILYVGTVYTYHLISSYKNIEFVTIRNRITLHILVVEFRFHD